MESGYGVLTEMEIKWPVRIRLASGNVLIIIVARVCNYFTGLKRKAQSVKPFKCGEFKLDQRHIFKLSFPNLPFTFFISYPSTFTTLDTFYALSFTL